MSFVNLQNGTQSASVLPCSASKPAEGRIDVRFLAELLADLNNHPTSHTPMLRSTAGKIAAFLGKPVDEIPLDLIHMNREGFRPFLEGQRLKEGSVRSYINYLRMLLDAAEELGWTPYLHLSAEWQPVLDLAKKRGCLAIVKWSAQVRESPEDVTQEDLDRWIEQRTKQGIRYSSAYTNASAFRRVLIDCGCTKNIPLVHLRRIKYGVPLSKFPATLRSEVTEVLRWKTADFEPNRPSRAHIRERSAINIRDTISSLYGFATNVARLGEINSLEELIQRPVFAGFVAWYINERKLRSGPLGPRLAAVVAAVSKHPAHRAMDVSWFRELRESIPVESYEAVKARKARKYVSYDVLESLPAKIHATRSTEARLGEEHIARLVMGELIISLLLVYLWRQLNLRECRVSGPNPNLFKATIPDYSYIDKPEWARAAEEADPNREFWQVRFSTEETKTKVPIHSLVPHHLVGLLEEYLSKHRPVLLKGRNCDTLFVPPEAGETRRGFMTDMVSELTLRYAGRRVTPHIFRDIVAHAWLKAHPKDYLTLSKMLWHKKLETTINTYGSRFNDSSATVAMESWLDQRGSGAKQK